MAGSRTAPSLAGRFAAAIALTVGFYALALLIAAALIGLPIYGWAETGRGNIWLTIFCVVTGGSILWAIVPRRLQFTAPGPRLDAQAQPRLAAAVAEVARETGEEPPQEMYATLDVNASVTELSNGFLRGRRRILVVGLPLLHLLSERSFRGVLAHEFGHYAGGDTRLGPWIWRTRETIGRTIDRLTDDADESIGKRIVRAPFIWYGKAFLRITNAISRREEFAADALAARTVGRDAHTEALRRVRAFGAAYRAYWAEDVGPALDAGYRPPLLAGFARFVRSEQVERAAAAHLERELAEARSDPYDSHPTLAERIAAVEQLPAGPPDDSPPASTLLEDEAALERAALAAVGAGDLRPLRWEDAAERVWLAGYAELVGHHRELLEGRTVADLGELAAEPEPLEIELIRREPDLPREAAPGFARHLLGAALALALAREGWHAEALPGEPLVLTSGARRLVPAEVVAALAEGGTSPAAWREQAGALGVDGAQLDEGYAYGRGDVSQAPSS